MLGEPSELDDDDDAGLQQFTRRASFTEKCKQRLELYRRRSLPQANDDGRWPLAKVRSSTKLDDKQRFVRIQIRYTTQAIKRGASQFSLY